MKNKSFFILYIIIWVLLLFYIPEVLKNINIPSLDWIIFILIFIIQPLILYYKILPNFISKKEILNSISGASIFLAIPFALFLSKENQKELDIYGIETKAVVTKIHRARLSKRNYGDVFNAEYVVNGKTYTTRNISIKQIDC